MSMHITESKLGDNYLFFVIPSFEIGNKLTQGILWGLATALTFAILSILNRRYVKEYSSLVINFYQDSVAAIVLLPFLFFMPVFKVEKIQPKKFIRNIKKFQKILLGDLL